MSSLREEEQQPAAASVTEATSCDVLVIGGGPAGSTVSSLLAESGWKVTLLEKDRHPRFHIGESLLPMNLPILERLGVLQEVRRIGVVKPGVEMNSDRRAGRRQTYYFDKLPSLDHQYAFQVRRSEFDHLLLQNSSNRGVEVHEGIRVTDIDFRPGSATLISARDSSGRVRSWAARYVVDASGRNAFLSTRLGLKAKDKSHNSAAIFGHFKRAVRRVGRDEGNIGLYWFEHGWIWMIPLRDDVMSVGAVCWPDYLKSRTGGLDAFLWDTIRLCPGAHERMTQAELIGPAKATGNYSYYSRRIWGECYILVGDAYAFVDPVFSSGVYLAMSGASMSATVVDACLREGQSVDQLLKQFESQIKGGLRTLSWFIHRFTTPATHDLFMAPRNILGIEQAILSTLSGNVYHDDRSTAPIALFKAIYYLVACLTWSRSWASYRRRKGNVLLDFADQTVERR